MKRFYKHFYLILLITSCYGINEKTSHIGYLNTECISPNAWDKIKGNYSPENITDPFWQEVLLGFKKETFPTSVLYFKENPEELIGIEYSSVRYVYNPKIQDEILNGLSPGLNDKEQKRIRNRVQKLLMEYQCSDGKKEALELMAEPVY